MSDSLIDAFRHNAWATRTLLDFCKELSEEELNLDEYIGTFGSIIATLRHLVNAEGNYRFLLTGEWIFQEWGWFNGESPGLDVLENRAKDSEAFWEKFLSRPVDPDRSLSHAKWIEVDGEPKQVPYETKLGVVLAQALSHGNHHRAEVCVILTQLGKEPPDLHGFSYGKATGRRVPRRPA